MDNNSIEIRQKTIGGSDAPAVVGVCKYRTPLEVYLEKIGEKIDRPKSGAMIIGSKFEYDILVFLGEELKKEVESKFNNKVIHPEIPYMSCQIDGLVKGENSIVECKVTTNRFSELLSKVPDNYMIQCQHNMAVHGSDRCYLPWMLIDPHSEIKKGIHIIDRDDEMIGYILDIERKFWIDHVEAKNPPSIDFSSFLASGVLAQMYPIEQEGKEVELPESFLTKIEKRQLLKSQMDEIEVEMLAIDNEIKANMCEASVAFSNGQKIATWKTTNMSRLDTTTLRQEAPDTYQKYLKQSQTRRFLINYKGDK